MRKLRSRIGAASLAGILLVVVVLGGCDTEENLLAPYEGDRPLIVQAVTTSFAPDISWVGGRAAAVGINRGEQAALDSSLIWIYTANGNELDSPVFVREAIDRAAVESFGGTPTDSLADDETYTLWVADDRAFDAGLTGDLDAHSLVDTTFHLKYLLTGSRPPFSGGLGITFDVIQDERLAAQTYTVEWDPATPLRRLAIRAGTTGGFNNLIWHIVTPEEEEAGLMPPIVINDPPEGAIVATEWEGFGTDRYVLWGASDDWDGESFSFRTEGYAFYQITHFYEPEESEE